MRNSRLVISVSLMLAVCIALVFSVNADDSDVYPPGKAFSFTEVTAKAKISGNPGDGGHGVAFVDVDNDGDLDIYVTNTPGIDGVQVKNYLYINKGDGTFQNQAILRGVDGEDVGSHACVFFDYDNDGDFDLVVANAGGRSGPAQNRLYKNDGSGYFEDITGKTALSNRLYRTRGIAAGDFVGNGYIDLVITNPVAATDAEEQPLLINRFLLNKKSKYSWKLNGLNYTGFSQGLTVGDIDGDGDLDMVESKRPDYNYNGISNVLWINKGKGSFVDESDRLGDTFHRDGSNGYNGAAMGDIDNDGDLDLLIVAEQKVRLYRNDGDLDFVEITDSSGIYGKGYTGAFGDLDHDGDLDLVIADDAQGHLVFRNIGNCRFSAVGSTGLFPPIINDPRGMALGDYDNDGDLDICVVHKLNIAQLFQNNLDKSNYIKLRLTAPNGEAGAIGAKVWLYDEGKAGVAKYMRQFREVGSSTGYVSQNSPEVHFGVKKAKKRVDIVIRHMNGTEIVLKSILPGRTITVDFN